MDKIVNEFLVKTYDSLKCEVCKCILDNAVVMYPCGRAICKWHQFVEKEIDCGKCDKTHVVPNEGFTSCIPLNQLIESLTNMERANQAYIRYSTK